MRANIKICNLHKNKKLIEELLDHIKAIESIKLQLNWEGRTDLTVEFIEDGENINAVSGN